MDIHATGCYTSQAAMKLYNRRNEQLGDAAERISVMADYIDGASYPANTLTAKTPAKILDNTLFFIIILLVFISPLYFL